MPYLSRGLSCAYPFYQIYIRLRDITFSMGYLFAERDLLRLFFFYYYYYFLNRVELIVFGFFVFLIMDFYLEFVLFSEEAFIFDFLF